MLSEDIAHWRDWEAMPAAAPSSLRRGPCGLLLPPAMDSPAGSHSDAGRRRSLVSEASPQTDQSWVARGCALDDNDTRDRCPKLASIVQNRAHVGIYWSMPQPFSVGSGCFVFTPAWVHFLPLPAKGYFAG